MPACLKACPDTNPEFARLPDFVRTSDFIRFATLPRGADSLRLLDPWSVLADWERCKMLGQRFQGKIRLIRCRAVAAWIVLWLLGAVKTISGAMRTTARDFTPVRLPAVLFGDAVLHGFSRK